MTTKTAGGSYRRAATIALLGLAAAAGAISWTWADEKPAGKKADLAKELVGTWVLAGTPDKPEDPPAKGGRLKFFTGKHWLITQADPDTGRVVFHHGGTYTLDGDEYSETIEYANENTAGLIGKTLKFKIKVEKDTYTQEGVGNEFNEVWKRAK